MLSSRMLLSGMLSFGVLSSGVLSTGVLSSGVLSPGVLSSGGFMLFKLLGSVHYQLGIKLNLRMILKFKLLLF
jgi:hypothetical protein